MDEATRARIRHALKQTTITRNRSCSELGGCRTFKVRPIRLDDEADAVIDAVMRALKREGYAVASETGGKR